MGQSTDAVLVYGVDLGDYSEGSTRPELFGDDEEIEELVDWLAADAGIANPYEDGVYGTPQQKEAEAARHKLMEEVGVDFLRHCSGEYPMWLLVAPGTVTRVWRGYVQSINPQELEAPSGADTKLEEFCKKHDLPFKKPSWLLVSDWN